MNVCACIGYPYARLQADPIRAAAGICITKILRFVSSGGLWGGCNGARIDIILLEVY